MSYDCENESCEDEINCLQGEKDELENQLVEAEKLAAPAQRLIEAVRVEHDTKHTEPFRWCMETLCAAVHDYGLVGD